MSKETFIFVNNKNIKGKGIYVSKDSTEEDINAFSVEVERMAGFNSYKLIVNGKYTGLSYAEASRAWEEAGNMFVCPVVEDKKLVKKFSKEYL